MTGAQIRAARALVGWSAGKLAGASKVSLATLQRAEKEDGPVRMTAANVDAVRRSLEAAGVVFTTHDSGVGVWIGLPRGASGDAT